MGTEDFTQRVYETVRCGGWAEKLVLGTIALHAERSADGKVLARVPQDTVARQTDLTKRTVQRAVRRLEAAGQVSVQRTTGPAAANIFHLRCLD